MLLKLLVKLKMHYLGPYIIWYVTKEGVVQLENLNGEPLDKLLNGIRLKVYKDNYSLTKDEL